MIKLARSYVNYQTILSSIDSVQQQVTQTQDHTNYINNFLTPYLKSDYAPYFFAHENNQIFIGEKIITIIHIATGTNQGDDINNNANISGGLSLPTATHQRNLYLKELGSSIKRGYESFF